MDKVINSCLSFANSYPRLCIAPFRQECSFLAALSRREEALTLFMLTRWKEHVSIFAHGSIQPTFINIRGSAKRESERRRLWGTLAARFIDIFAPWMWQVLLRLLVNSGTCLQLLPLEISFFWDVGEIHSTFCQCSRNFYECSLSGQDTVCSLLLTTGTEWWRVCVWRCRRLKITHWTFGKTLKTHLDNFCGQYLRFINLSEVNAHL